MMQHEVDKTSPAAVMLPVQQLQDNLLGEGAAAAAAAVPCVRPSTSGSSGGSPPGIQRGNVPPQNQQQVRPPPNARTITNSTVPAQSSPLQQSQVPNRPRTASSSQQQNPAALVLQQLARSGTQSSSNSAPAIPQTPTYSRPNTTAVATTPSGGVLPALPPSPPLTRSATRSRSSVITATQNQQYVDYLLQNGGLTRPISINFSPQRDPHEIAYISLNGSEIPEVSYAPLNSGSDDPNGEKALLTVFAPLHYSLDAYTQILTNSGSVAVGTGYRSVARRLLERVEALFARDIGLPWGETLEWLRGKRRRERLPPLPVLPTKGLLKQNISTADGEETPTVLGNNQIAEEPRQQIVPSPVVPLIQPPADGQGVHQMLAEGEKIRTKTKVEEWLDETETVLSTTINNNAAGPVPNSGPIGMVNGKPSDAAGIFYVNLANQFNGTSQNSQAFNISQDAASTASQEEEEEKIVSGIVMGLLKESPLQKELYTQYLSDNALLERTMLALRRLYPAFPAHTITRSIAALYLLLHPDLHHVLEAISRITKGELDLLNSGRFDGFLDEKDVIPADEEKELEALEILDGNIFRTMEKLEDEIEALHVRAEEVRRKLRVRKEAIARKMVLAGKDKDSSSLSGGGGAMDQFGGMLSRQNSAASNSMVKHVQLPPPPPKSDYFEGLDKESTLNPIFPDDSASNYGSRHRRRTTRKATSSALAGEEGDLVRRGSTGSGAAGSPGAGTAAQHLMKKQLEKDKRDKERTREKFEKERERREKEERRKAKLANAAANIGFHHREGAGAVLPPPPYSSGGEMGGEKEKGLLPGSPLVPKRKKSKEEHKEKEKEKRDRHRSPERPSTSGKKGFENPQSREFDTAGAGTTMVATSPPTLLEDAFAPMIAGKERPSKDKESKKRDKNKEDKEKDKSRKEIDDDQPTPAEEQKDSQDSKRKFSLKFPKFRSSDHENDASADSIRPGTSGSLRPTTAQSANTAITNATNATGTAIGPTDVPSSSSGKHRKERKHHSRREVIPEADEDDDDGDEKIIRQHHTTRRKNSRRAGATPAVQNSTANFRAALEVLSEPEDMFGREERPSYNITGVFSEDEGAAGGLTGFAGTNDIKQQLMSRKGIRRGSESKGAGAGGEGSNEPTVKEKSKDRKTREHREERRERKRLEREAEEELEKEKAQLRFSIGMSHASSHAGLPMFPLLSSQPPSAPGSHLGDILPSSVALPRLSVAMSDDPSRAESAVSDNTPNHNHRSRKGKEKERDRDRDHRDKDRDRKPEYKPSFSSSTGGASGHGPTGGVSLLGLEANEHGYGADGLLTSTYLNGGVKEGNLNSATATTPNNINNLNLNNNNSGMMDAEVMTLGEGTTMVGDTPDEVGSLQGRSRTPRSGGGGPAVGPGPEGGLVGGPGDRLSLDFFNGID